MRPPPTGELLAMGDNTPVEDTDAGPSGTLGPYALAAAPWAAQRGIGSFDEARSFVLERVKANPLMVALAVLGAGFLLGVLFAGKRP